MMRRRRRLETFWGIGVLGLQTILYVSLKLGGFITWPWWWVLSPAWGPFALSIAAMLVVAIVLLVDLLRSET